MLKRYLFVVLFVFFVVTGLHSATVKLTTYAAFNMQVSQNVNDDYVIEKGVWNPNSFMELKFDINLNKEFSIWMRANATSNTNERNYNYDFTFYDLHAKYLKNLSGDSGFEIISFMRETSYTYLNQPLLGFTDEGDFWGSTDDKGDKGSMNGLYFNAWNIAGFNFARAFLISSGIGGDNESRLGAGLRVRKDFLKGGLKIGATGMVFMYDSGTDASSTNVNYFQEGFDIDTSLLGPFSLVYEMGFCHIPGDSKPDKQPITFKGELRGNFALFDGNLGQTGFLASVYYVGEKYSNWRGKGADGEPSDRLIERIEWYYNFPLKAIYLKQNLVYSHKLSDGSKSHLWQYEFDIANTGMYLESYTELYIEFINGFKFKTYYKHVNGGEMHRIGLGGKWNYLLFQLEVENEFAKIKPMVLLLDLGNESLSATVFGAEVLINLTSNIKFYSRFAMVAGSEDPSHYKSDSDTRNWSTFFAQLQFLKVFSNTDIYLSFGNGDHTKNDLVHDINGVLAGSEMEKRFNLSVSFWL